ncbi:MAG TPA: hypothetical protein VMT34_04205 [Aggregatilineales bacterium]|nr:hypothetical protein [Aggregatilineales bacterium]
MRITQRSFVVVIGIAMSLLGWMLVSVQPAHAEPFSVTMNCPNNVTYTFTNDTNTTNQYYVTVSDSQGQGLGSSSFTNSLGPGSSVTTTSGSTANSFDLVKVPAPGNLTATLWRRVVKTGAVSNAGSVSLKNCWPASLSTPGSTVLVSGSQPPNSRITFVCSTKGVTLGLLNDQGQPLAVHVTFANQALLAAGQTGLTRALQAYGSLSIAGSMGWNGMWYYAAWNGGVLNANGRNEFSNTFQCVNPS